MIITLTVKSITVKLVVTQGSDIRGGPSNLIKGGFQADDTESAIDKFLSIPDKTITVKFIVCYLLIGLKKITHQ